MILHYPNPILKEISKPVKGIDSEVKHTIKCMLDAIYKNDGIGLAAVQIGVLLRILIINIDEKSEPTTFINPEITKFSKETNVYEEGCLSIPDPKKSKKHGKIISLYEKVTRPSTCDVKFIDGEGKPREIHCEGLMATCIQHEVDHLNGILFIDHLSRLRRMRIKEKFHK